MDTAAIRHSPLVAAVATSLALSCGSALAFDQQTDSRTYLVAGTSADEIRAGLDRLGPFDPHTGLRRDSLTTWQIEWRFDTRMAGSQCEINRAQVDLRIARTMPRLADVGALARAVRRDWERYFAALRQYEDGRAQIGVRAAQEIESAVAGLKRNDCAGLQNLAETTARNLLEEARARDLAYEQQTGRGRALGARFPWTEGDRSQLTEAEQRKLDDRVAHPPGEVEATPGRAR